MEAILIWIAAFDDCWLQIVRQRWCNKVWLQKSNSCRERRSLMTGPAHRQGSSSFPRYRKILEKKNKRPMSDLDAYYASRQGSEIGIFCNDKARQVVKKYTEVAKEIHGPDFDVMKAPLDPDLVYKAGGGKKHGRHFIANGYIDSRVSASQSRSTTIDGVRPSRRVRTTVDRVGELEVQVAELRQIVLNQNQHVPINGMAAIHTSGGTPGIACSVGNNTTPSVDDNPQENVNEMNDDVVM